MRHLIKVNHWYLVQLNNVVVMGKTNRGDVTIKADLVDLENKLFVSGRMIYKLGSVDKVWEQYGRLKDFKHVLR